MSERRPSATVVTQTRVAEGKDEEFAAWQSRMKDVVAEQPGFVSQQIIPAEPPEQPDWVIVQRFEDRGAAQAWLGSDTRAQMLDGAGPLLVGDDSISVLDDAVHPADRAVTAVIRSAVAPGREEDFRAWHDRIDAVQRRAPGYIGCALQAPVPGVQDEWVTILAFDSHAHLDAWIDSAERAALVDEADGMMRDTQLRTVDSGFEGWFAFGSDDQGGATPPAPWKLNYLVLVGLYPIVMLEILFLNPLLEWLPLGFSNLIGNIISVSLLGWPVIALLSVAMKWWVNPGDQRSARNDVLGALVLLALLAVIVAIFLAVEGSVDITPITEL